MENGTNDPRRGRGENLRKNRGKNRGQRERERGRERERSSLREVIHAATRSRFSFTQRIMHLELTISKG